MNRHQDWLKQAERALAAEKEIYDIVVQRLKG
jgi:hypothetical protein